MAIQSLEEEAVTMTSRDLPLWKSHKTIAMKIICMSGYGKRKVNFRPIEYPTWNAAGFMELVDTAIERLGYEPNWLGNRDRNGRVYSLREK